MGGTIGNTPRSVKPLPTRKNTGGRRPGTIAGSVEAAIPSAALLTHLFPCVSNRELQPLASDPQTWGVCHRIWGDAAEVWRDVIQAWRSNPRGWGAFPQTWGSRPQMWGVIPWAWGTDFPLLAGFFQRPGVSFWDTKESFQTWGNAGPSLTPRPPASARIPQGWRNDPQGWGIHPQVWGRRFWCPGRCFFRKEVFRHLSGQTFAIRQGASCPRPVVRVPLDSPGERERLRQKFQPSKSQKRIAPAG